MSRRRFRKQAHKRKIRVSTLPDGVVISQRSCLKCRKEFPSLGANNRICDICNQENMELSERGQRTTCSASSKIKRSVLAAETAQAELQEKQRDDY